MGSWPLMIRGGALVQNSLNRASQVSVAVTGWFPGCVLAGMVMVRL